VNHRPDALARNTAQHGDALTLLRSLPDRCAPLGFFDPQHREGVLLGYLRLKRSIAGGRE
jgi:hypothetical protein